MKRLVQSIGVRRRDVSALRQRRVPSLTSPSLPLVYTHCAPPGSHVLRGVNLGKQNEQGRASKVSLRRTRKQIIYVVLWLESNPMCKECHFVSFSIAEKVIYMQGLHQTALGSGFEATCFGGDVLHSGIEE